MTQDFFLKQVDRLRGVYSAASLSQERIEVLWNRFKGIDNNQFHGAVSFLIGEFTTQQLPPVSRFEEAVGRFAASKNPREGSASTFEIAYTCEPCRDFGYGWIGDEVTRCTCFMGRRISQEEIARAQRGYNAGKSFRSGKRFGSVSMALPYDPRKSVAEEDGILA